MKIFTSGVLSGLGKYIYENLGGFGFTRRTTDEEMKKIKNDGVDVIIHCAFNSARSINSNSLYQYFEDNVLLTKELVLIPHKKFIFISTVDLYPRDSQLYSEDEIIELDNVKGIYATTKLISESIVKKYCKNYIILRPTTLLGKYSRKNTILKIKESNGGYKTGLSGDSIYNCVLHSDILDFIKYSVKNDITGIFNISSSKYITLRKIAKLFNKSVEFGNHIYNVGNISNTKITKIFPVFNKISAEILNSHEY